MIDNNKKKNKVVIISVIVGLFLLAFGLTYALFTITLNGTKKVKISTGNLNLRLLDANDNYIDNLNPNADTGFDIKLENAVPMTDEEAAARNDNVYTFKVKNEGTINARYSISLEDLELSAGEERIDDKYIGYEILRDGKDAGEFTRLDKTENRVIDYGLIEPNQVHTYSLRLWIRDISDQNDAMSKVFYTHIKLDGVQTKATEEVELVINNVSVDTKNGAVATYNNNIQTNADDESGRITIPNLFAQLPNKGAEFTYTITVENKGVLDVEVSTDHDYLSYYKCITLTTNTHPECAVWDLNEDQVINAIDIAELFRYINKEFPSATNRTKVKSGEKKTITLYAKYKEDVENPITLPTLFDGDLVINYSVW